MTRRLLQIIAGAPHGGAETFFVRLAAALQRAGEQQRVLIRRNAPRARALHDAGIAVTELRFGGRLDLATRRGIARAIAEWRPDIVLTWMSRATRLCPPGDFVHVARLGGYYDLKHYRRCRHLIGNTRDIADYAVRSGWPVERVHWLPNFVPEPPPAAALPRDPGMPLALALGRLHPNKGFDVLLEALARAPGIALWLAGDGPLRARLEGQAARLGLGGRVRFLGWREDVPALLATADLLVCPSRIEPLGNVVLEAWAARLPVVAAAAAGPAALIEDRVSGLLVPAEDPAALAAAMTAAIADPALRMRLAAAGRRAYEAGFTEAEVVARYRALFDRIAA
jgi:glycosyltransferase involved in cell wall biosynthesis